MSSRAIRPIKVITASNQLKVMTDTYMLTIAADRPFATLEDADGHDLAELFCSSSVHTLHGLDDTVSLGPWEVAEHQNEIVLSLEADSSVWDKKRYHFRCRPERLSYEIEVEGQGQLAEVTYFGGYYSAQPRWGSGMFWSGQHFRQGFNPEPTVEEHYYFAPSAGSTIDLSGVPLPAKGGWFFTPPPFCFAFEGEAGWLGMGLEAQPSTNRYTDYRYRGQETGFYLSLAYEGHTAIDGRYRLPAIGFDFAADAYGTLTGHIKSLTAQDFVPLVNRHKPRWWYEPILCGWGAQCCAASIQGGHAPDFARQTLYEAFLTTLESQQVTPGIVVLDDKWQASYGGNGVDETKWPDLKGFVARQHAAGRKVLLWLKAWDPEGLPAEECITNAAGLSLAADPSNPAFETRFRASIRHMLSAEGYNADGFKLDFTARIPNGPGIHTHGDIWGLELMKLYLGILYDEAKKTKPDALVMTHTPHPYLADVLDMIRLNDINTGKDVGKAMAHRARVTAIACPDALIDTDNWPMTDKATWREYLKLQPTLGVPSLYYVSHVGASNEPLEAEDYRLIRDLWAGYREKLARKKDGGWNRVNGV